jgi:ribokinase
MIVVFGSINLDPILPPARHPARGPNIARARHSYRTRRQRRQPGGWGCRDGAQVVVAGAIGRDALAAGALDLLRSARIDLPRVVETDAATGCAAIFVDPQGTNAIGIGSGANLAARATQIEDAPLGPATTLVL